MFIKQPDIGIQYTGWIRFVSHIADSMEANGRRRELSSLYNYPINTTTSTEWETKIPDEWEEDNEWCVITQFKSSLGGSPTLAIELLSGNMVIVSRTDLGKQWLYDQPMIKGERLKFKTHIRWTGLNNGYIQIWMNSRLIVDFKGVTYFAEATKGPYFKIGIYMATVSKVIKRTIYHRV